MAKKNLVEITFKILGNEEILGKSQDSNQISNLSGDTAPDSFPDTQPFHPTGLGNWTKSMNKLSMRVQLYSTF